MFGKKKKSADIRRPKEQDKTEYVGYAVIGVFSLYASTAVGAAADKTAGADGKIRISGLSDEIGNCLANPSFVFERLSAGMDGFALKALFVGALVIGLTVMYNFSKSKKRTHQRGVEHGSAKWADKEEIATLKDVGEATKDVKKVPIKRDGKRVFDDKGELLCAEIDNNLLLTEEVKLSLNTRQHMLNLNCLIVGGSGSGKTYKFVTPNIMQMNTSYVITDPKGEILQTTGKMLVENGYELKVFNLVNMKNSSNYNPLQYIYDFDGNLTETAVVRVAKVILKTSKGDGEKDDFWTKSAQFLLEAVLFLLVEESEKTAEWITNKDGEKVIKPGTRDISHLNMASVGEKLRKISYPIYDEETGEAKSELAKDFAELEARKPDTLAFRRWKSFAIAPPETGQSIISTLSATTNSFEIKEVMDLTCCDTLELDKIGDRKTAFFIIIPSSDSTYNFIVSLMYTQLFQLLTEKADTIYHGRLPWHVRCILDEFANISQIPAFEEVIAIIRSREISVNVIIQTVSQLKTKYEKSFETIKENCDSYLFLGGKGLDTTKEIMEMLGKETIDSTVKNKTTGGGGKSNSTSESNSIMGRELLMQNELITMDVNKCVLIMKSHNPVFGTKYTAHKHPNCKFTEYTDPKNAFDYSSIKVKTLIQFQAECAEKHTKKGEQSTVTLDKKKLDEAIETENKIIEKSALKTEKISYEVLYSEIQKINKLGIFEIEEYENDDVIFDIETEIIAASDVNYQKISEWANVFEIHGIEPPRHKKERLSEISDGVFDLRDVETDTERKEDNNENEAIPVGRSPIAEKAIAFTADTTDNSEITTSENTDNSDYSDDEDYSNDDFEFDIFGGETIAGEIVDSVVFGTVTAPEAVIAQPDADVTTIPNYLYSFSNSL